LDQEHFAPPAGFNVRAELAGLSELPVRTAVVDVQSGRLHGLRRRALPDANGPDAVGRPDAGPDAAGPDAARPPLAGRDRLRVAYRDDETFAEELASYGPRVLVVSPPELVAAVRRRLAAAAEFAASPAPPIAFPAPSSGPGVHTHGRKRTSEDQLTRMLQLVPFLVHNQGLHISVVADKFGITRQELEADLRILICSGLPEGYPDDLLDIQWDDDHVTISEDLDLKRPVRFTVEEACALLTGLETLNGLPELAEGGALESVTLKLMAAAGAEGLKAAALSGPEVAPGNSAALETASEAIRTGAQLRLRYFSLLRDTVSERNIDPLRLYSLDNTWYLEAYCHAAQGLRNFRLDRIETLETTGRPVSERAQPGGSFPVKLFTPNDDDTVVVVELTRRGSGVADEYYAERTAELPGGGLLAEIRFGSTDWLPMFVAQHGGTARILEPREIADASRAWLAAALAQYED
ncbi:MAG TPA: WYL domain-containing protein, partial [Arthrobacter sp.]|nr:WYL domain-containing protein [Arthrobacter sp.]